METRIKGDLLITKISENKTSKKKDEDDEDDEAESETLEKIEELKKKGAQVERIIAHLLIQYLSIMLCCPQILVTKHF